MRRAGIINLFLASISLTPLSPLSSLPFSSLRISDSPVAVYEEDEKLPRAYSLLGGAAGRPATGRTRQQTGWSPRAGPGSGARQSVTSSPQTAARARSPRRRRWRRGADPTGRGSGRSGTGTSRTRRRRPIRTTSASTLTRTGRIRGEGWGPALRDRGVLRRGRPDAGGRPAGRRWRVSLSKAAGRPEGVARARRDARQPPDGAARRGSGVLCVARPKRWIRDQVVLPARASVR